MNHHLVVCCVLACVWCQSALPQTMTVHTKNGQQPFVISEIDSITFSSGSANQVGEWVTVPAGEYTYGEGDTVRTLDYDFSIMKYEVTNAQYLQYL